MCTTKALAGARGGPAVHRHTRTGPAGSGLPPKQGGSTSGQCAPQTARPAGGCSSSSSSKYPRQPVASRRDPIAIGHRPPRTPRPSYRCHSSVPRGCITANSACCRRPCFKTTAANKTQNRPAAPGGGAGGGRRVYSRGLPKLHGEMHCAKEADRRAPPRRAPRASLAPHTQGADRPPRPRSGRRIRGPARGLRARWCR